MAEQKTTLSMAKELADKAHTFIEQRVGDTLTRATAAYDTALGAIDALDGINLDFPADITLVEPSINTDVRIWKEGHPPPPDEVPVPAFNDPGLVEGTLDDITPGTAPTYTAPIVTITTPTAPPPIDLGTLPVEPSLDYSGVVMPADPVLAYPVMDTLTAITIPAFVAPSMPTFSEVAPDFTAAAPGSIQPWVEPDYTQDLLPDVRAVIVRLMDGNAIPAVVEQALWDRARMREDVVAEKAVADAFGDWAGRGFTMPPGMLVEQVNVARQDAALKTNTLSRDVAIKHAEWMQENVRFSVQQGLAYEQLLINLWLDGVKRTYEMSRLAVETALKLYDVQVAVFNAKVGAYKTKADVWRTQIEGVVAELNAYKTQLEAEKTKGEINEQKVRIFTARMNALQTVVDVYKAQVSAVQTKVDTIKTRIESYRVQVQAYGEWLGAQKVAYDAYESQVKAETSKATLLETTARAFAAEVQGFSTVEDVKVKRYEAQARVLATKVDAYKVRIDAERAKVDSAIQRNRVGIEEFSARVELYKADQNMNAEQARLTATLSENSARIRMAFLDARVREWQSKATALTQRADLQARGLQAAAQAATGLANATMSAVHYNAGFSGGGTVSASHQESY